MAITNRVAILMLVLCSLTWVSVSAQDTAQPEGWQGPRPAPQKPAPLPKLQPAAPAGKQVLEIPSQRQQTVPELPQQQIVTPSRPQPASTRPTQLLTVTVTDGQGRYVRGLKPEDFVVYENDLPQQITYFNTGQQEPVSVGFLIDMSGSMENKTAAARRALLRFIGTIRPHDEVFLAAFNDAPYMLQDFTDSRALLKGATALLQPQGETALYDAVLDGLRRVKDGRCQKQVLVVITDGVDTASRSSLKETLAAVRQSGVIVYTIGVGNQGIRGPRRGFGMMGPRVHRSPRGGGYGSPSDNERVEAGVLQTLSDETGGKNFLLNPADVIGNGTVLDTATQAISDELQQQYSVGYRSPLKGDMYRGVRIESRKNGIVVRTHKGLG